MKTASKPPAKRKRYCAFKPVNSTVRPTPLLISNAAIALQEETSQDSGSHDEEDTRTEPRGCGLARIGVTTRELVVHFYSSYQPHYRIHGIDEFRTGIEVGGDHLRGLIDISNTIALCVCSHGGSCQE